MVYREYAFYAQEQWTLEIEGCTVRVDPDQTGADLEPGDLYVAERNTGPKLLTVDYVKKVSPWPGEPYNLPPRPVRVFPKNKGYYPYDVGECRKVVEIDGEPVE